MAAVDAAAIPCTGEESVLLLQDNVPWEAGADQDPSGANVTELLAQSVAFCTSGSAALASMDLSRFSTVVISAAQAQAFYDNLFPFGVVDPALTAFVERGGVLVANLADVASGAADGGNWAGYAFVSGLQRTTSFRNDNTIADGSHPIIAGPSDCPSGNCAPIQDAAVRQDLDNWFHSSHGYFTHLPVGATVLLTQPDATLDSQPEPIMVEYSVGSGRVIGSMVTTEQRYSSNKIRSLKLLANELAYALSISVPVETPDLSVQEQIGALVAAIEALAADGKLSPGNAISLERKLMAALRSLESGRLHTAVNQIHAFMLECEALVLSGQLDPADAQPLLEIASFVIEALRAG